MLDDFNKLIHVAGDFICTYWREHMIILLLIIGGLLAGVCMVIDHPEAFGVSLECPVCSQQIGGETP